MIDVNGLRPNFINDAVLCDFVFHLSNKTSVTIPMARDLLLYSGLYAFLYLWRLSCFPLRMACNKVHFPHKSILSLYVYIL